MSIYKFLIFLWIVVSVKQILFWVYLWQLKEYHIPRFIDHFRTAKGKELLFNKLRIAKIILLFSPGFVYYYFTEYMDYFAVLFLYLLFSIYLVEDILFTKQILRKSAKKPKFTKKSAFLVLVCLIFIALFLVVVESMVDLLILDIILPIIISGIVLCFQPFVVWVRKGILTKAGKIILQNSNLKVIGITGSYGKTTTKEFLATILASKFKVLATQEHKNSEMGIAQTILNDLKLEHEFFIVEMGAYKKGGIKLLCDMVHPEIGIVTGVTVQHLSLFGNLDNLLSAEGGRELKSALPLHGFMVVNGENKYCIDLYKKINIKKLIYTEEGNKIDSDIFAKEIEVTKDKLSFVAITRDKQMAHFEVNILGKHNLQNLLGAILTAKKLGMSLEDISQACRDIKPEQAGVTAKIGINNINIIDSSYSSNPDGALADLETLKLFSGKKIVVMSCLIELGKQSAQEHYKIGRRIGEVCNLAIITTKDKFEEIKKGAVDGGMEARNILFIENPQEIFHKITTFCIDGDTVLLEGRVPDKLIKLLNEK